MQNSKRLAFFTAIILSLAFAVPWTGHSAELWPQRTVKFVVPLGPASGSDVTARLLADQLSRRWGQAVVVENRPGADGVVGLTAFLSGSDDHVLLFTPAGSFTAYPFLHEKVPYNLNQLAPIARVTNTLIAVTVPTSLNVNSLAS